ncbi:hypothetical protein Tsubulata_039071 [Turnera subulata]|uniref:HMG box domain-containing protein n=1 Tax=Turnera subulata TaxID=218843 RepID=A0A9Q0GAN5_9ROSI|nr:hypothetical protein Tsubulata_039071 [Turnera subulata]
MGNPPRTRKRVHAIRRAPDGSAFQKCGDCGVLVAIALADMHGCGSEAARDVKRFKGVNGNKLTINKQSLCDQPRSPFRVFMDDFVKTCKNMELIDIERKGFETWRNMSNEEREPFVIQSNKVNSAYNKFLIQEIDDMPQVEDEADSAMVGKFDTFYEDYGYNDSDNLDDYSGYDDSD